MANRGAARARFLAAPSGLSPSLSLRRLCPHGERKAPWHEGQDAKSAMDCAGMRLDMELLVLTITSSEASRLAATRSRPAVPEVLGLGKVDQHSPHIRHDRISECTELCGQLIGMIRDLPVGHGRLPGLFEPLCKHECIALGA